MPCLAPLSAWRYQSRQANTSTITFDHHEAAANPSQPLQIPCGQCMACRLERSRQWAVRCLHESSLHEANSFVTLTYANEHLPPNLSLDVRPFQLFMKRLRKQTGAKIRFFACGEYGEKYGRPHYHACLFGYDFADKKIHSENHRQEPLFTSSLLDSVWQQGHCLIGSVTFDSAAYVARYVTKKITGPAAAAHYGERRPEFTLMSRRPGIGQAWLHKFKTDVYPHDLVLVNGKRTKPPRYYDTWLENTDPLAYEALKNKRAEGAPSPTTPTDYKKFHLTGTGFDETSKARLLAKAEVQSARAKQLKRNIE